jgi:hypothetical protein
MMYTLTIELAEETFEVLKEQAKEKGVEPAQVAAEWLSDAARRAEEMRADPLIALFGTIESPVTDVAERHDYYLGQAILKDLRDEPDIH